MIRALIFDFDGLILDTETPLIDSYGDVHATHGLPFDRAAFIRGVGHAEYSFDPWGAFGTQADRDQLETHRRTLNRERIIRQTILPGVKAILDLARERGLRLGLASNSQHDWVEPHLTRLGLRTYFEFIACREDVASPKPEPDSYKLVLNQFGLRGHEAIAFEDSAAGSVAAKRAGLWVVTVPNPSTAHHNFAQADQRLTSLADCDLDDLLARFNTA